MIGLSEMQYILLRIRKVLPSFCATNGGSGTQRKANQYCPKTNCRDLLKNSNLFITYECFKDEGRAHRIDLKFILAHDLKYNFSPHTENALYIICYSDKLSGSYGDCIILSYLFSQSKLGYISFSFHAWLGTTTALVKFVKSGKLEKACNFKR